MATLGKRPTVAAGADSYEVSKRSRKECLIDEPTRKECLIDEPNREKTGVGSEEHMKVCGPEFIQTLRGHLLGREVAIICCGEAHARALDLTRGRGIVEPVREWLEVPRAESTGFDPKDACETKSGVSLEAAKLWANNVLCNVREENEDDGVVLMYQPVAGSTQGVAHYFSVEHYLKRADMRKGKRGKTPANAVLYQWFDTDADVRADIHRMQSRKDLNLTQFDKVIAERKQQRRSEGLISLTIGSCRATSKLLATKRAQFSSTTSMKVVWPFLRWSSMRNLVFRRLPQHTSVYEP